ncbi:MAG: transporter substrate-binding domain-containing protein [Marinovum sp.]|nr:transporter substrate-binding domain-containing protein [Marinovum sp.]
MALKTASIAAAVAASVWFGMSGAAEAQETCGGVYTVQRGDSLSLIADNLYKNAGKWSTIHNSNLDTIGSTPNSIRVGMRLSVPCINGLPKDLAGGSAVTTAKTVRPLQIAPGTAATRSKINLLTADDYAPFTDRNILNGGLVTEVVHKAMEKAAPSEGFAIHWVNDWSAHLEPMLSNALLDLGFPWLQPDCQADPSQYRCENFYFSEPMFEMLILLFTNKSNPIQFNTDSDMLGKTLCRPAGYFTHDLDKNGRRWLADNLINLERPTTVGDCFEMLAEGKVDAVALNEFTGRQAIADLGLADRIEIVQTRPLSIEGLHVVVHKTHPQAQYMLETINNGLSEIKASGTYQQVINQHMSQIWASF